MHIKPKQIISKNLFFFHQYNLMGSRVLLFFCKNQFHSITVSFKNEIKNNYSVNLLIMKKNIMVDFQQAYPFGTCFQHLSSTTKILARQRVAISANSIKESLKVKLSLIRKATIQNMIQVQQIEEKNNEVYIIYQYVPILMEPWISNINSTFIQSTKLQLAKVASFLAENHIIAQIKLSQLGMNEKYQVKYFLGIDFQVNSQKSTYDLSINYMNQILQIFHPYLFGTAKRVAKKSMIDQPSKTVQQSYTNPTKQNVSQTPCNGSKQIPLKILQKDKTPQKKTKLVELLNKVNNFKKQNGLIRGDKSGKMNLNEQQQISVGALSQEKQQSQLKLHKKMKLSMPISPKECQQHINYFYHHPKHQIDRRKVKLNKSLEQYKEASDAQFAQNSFHDARKRISTLTIAQTDGSNIKDLLHRKVQIAISSSLVAIKKCKSISEKNE